MFLLGQVLAWRTIFANAVATLWVAASFHCRLEVLPGFEFLSCCQHSESEQSPAHHEKECNDDGCAAVELGLYRPETPQAASAMPLLALVTLLSPLPEHAQVSVFDHLVSISASPPELPKSWQFFQRTALPPRSPTFVS
jgi:hypothetical protein